MLFELLAREGQARRGRLTVTHGSVDTPAFMPVGTYGAVKAVSLADLADSGAQMVLSNTFHLWLRPGLEVIEAHGGLHRFMGWDGPLLTDSGGFQVFSLGLLRKITEEGVQFRSPVNGDRCFLSPEESMRIQRVLNSDVVMIFDECTPYPAEPARAQSSLELTSRWAERSLRARDANLDDGGATRALFGIVQGGIYSELRRMSGAQITALPFDGYAAGGLSVGEPKDAMREMAALTASLLPQDRPRYLMGVGTPADLIAAIAMGYDLFDCVLPTRNARNGSAFTSEGRVSIKLARHARDQRPLDPRCSCRCCSTYSRAYLRHLHMSGEILAARALTEHNLTFYARLMRQGQAAIASRTYRSFAREMLAQAEDGEDADEGSTGNVV